MSPFGNFLEAAARQGVTHIIIDEAEMKLHVCDYVVEIAEKTGHVAINSMTGDDENRASALKIVCKAADLAGVPLKFAPGVLSVAEENTPAFTTQNGYRSPHPNRTFIYGDPGRYAYKRFMRRSAFTEEMDPVLDRLRDAAQHGNVILVHTHSSANLPHTFLDAIAVMKAACVSEGRVFVEMSADKRYNHPTADIQTSAMAEGAAHLEDHVSFDVLAKGGVVALDSDPVTSSTENELRTLLRKRYENRISDVSSSL